MARAASTMASFTRTRKNRAAFILYRRKRLPISLTKRFLDRRMVIGFWLRLALYLSTQEFSSRSRVSTAIHLTKLDPQDFLFLRLFV
jgi:hypothetical protein